MNYRVMARTYWGGEHVGMSCWGTYNIRDATALVRRARESLDPPRDMWLEPTEEPIYRVWCRDYRSQYAGVSGYRTYPMWTFATAIGRATEEVALLRRTQRDGDAGADYWLVQEEDAA